MKPRRIQIKRKKGWRLPPNTVVVTRGKGRKWGNPHKIGPGMTRLQAVLAFRMDLLMVGIRNLAPLKGKNIACFCRVRECTECGQDYSERKHMKCVLCGGKVSRVPCHGDVLLHYANNGKAGKVVSWIVSEEPR